MISDTDPFQNAAFNNRLRKLLTSMDGIIGKSSITVRQQLTCERIVLHISHSSLKYELLMILNWLCSHNFTYIFRYTAKTSDIASTIASPKPAEWKFFNAAGSPWIELHCTLNVEFFLTLSDVESSATLRKQVEVRLICLLITYMYVINSFIFILAWTRTL